MLREEQTKECDCVWPGRRRQADVVWFGCRVLPEPSTRSTLSRTVTPQGALSSESLARGSEIPIESQVCYKSLPQ